jgi:hypothetical protein
MSQPHPISIWVNAGPVDAAMRTPDHAWLAGWIAGRFGFDMGERWVATQLGRLKKAPGYWSDSSWAAWWKRRLEDSGCFPNGSTSELLNQYTVTMHTGFLSLLETEEELEQLRRNNEPLPAGGPQTPAIERTMNMPSPIDATAARVTNQPRESK